MKLQVAKDVFLTFLAVMKEVLSLAEFKLGKDSEDYKYFKRMVMDHFYNALIRIFQRLEVEKLIVRCECLAKLRHGYSQCEACGGSGYRNVDPNKKVPEVAGGNENNSVG